MSASATTAPILVADVGGTHVRFALIDIDAAEPLRGETTRYYRPADFATFADAVRRYLGEVHARPIRAVIAAAGLRVDGEIRLTNLPWIISRGAIEREFEFERAELINDFAAMALSVLLLKSRDLLTIGAPVPARFDPDRTGKIKLLELHAVDASRSIVVSC